MTSYIDVGLELLKKFGLCTGLSSYQLSLGSPGHLFAMSISGVENTAAWHPIRASINAVRARCPNLSRVHAQQSDGSD